MPAEGNPAPTFASVDQNDSPVALADFAGRKVLVYFYPKADTPGCTIQACGLRDIAADIGDTVVLGVSPDAPPALKAFDDKFELGFTLVSDVDHSIAESYGVWVEKVRDGVARMGILRSAFLVDENGAVANAWPDISPADTPTNLLAALTV
jgi:peroxiredoxin Q/BCP